MTFTLNPHEFRKGKDGGPPTLIRVQPYTRLHSGDGMVVFIQGGKFYTESGDSVDEDDLPDWVDGEISKMTARAKAEVGLQGG